MNNEMMRKLILASSSPRCKEILEKLNIPFEVKPSNYEEDMTQDLTPDKLVIALSLGKAKDIALKNKNSVVIGADTIVFFNNNKLGKPKTNEVAKMMLSEMNGKINSVFTGYTVIDTASNKIISKSVETKVYMKKLSEEEIDDYVYSGEPLDKAGAYASQGLGAILVDKIDGDFFNVMGLPLSSLADTLKEFGISPYIK